MIGTCTKHRDIIYKWAYWNSRNRIWDWCKTDNKEGEWKSRWKWGGKLPRRIKIQHPNPRAWRGHYKVVKGDYKHPEDLIRNVKRPIPRPRFQDMNGKGNRFWWNFSGSGYNNESKKIQTNDIKVYFIKV